jgi:hypothetical protein
MTAWNGPRTGAGGGWVRVYGLGCGLARISRTLRRECPKVRAIARMDMPSRAARRIVP